MSAGRQREPAGVEYDPPSAGIRLHVTARPCPGAWSGQGCSNLAPPFLYRSLALHGPNQHSMVGSPPVITQCVPHENP